MTLKLSQPERMFSREFYTQALVNGYWVILKVVEQAYDFRVGSGGSFKLCPPGSGTPPIDRTDIY